MTNSKVDTNKVKSTERYEHHDLEGVDMTQIDQATIRTVCMPNGNRLVTGKNIKTGETQGLRLLVKKNES